MSRPSGKTPVHRGALVVTACLPVPEGLRVSLQGHLTPRQSTALYRRFLHDILETTQNVEGTDFYLSYSPRGSRELLDAIAPEQFRLLCQEGRETGRRFSKLVGRLFARGYESVVLLCSNHPDLPACLIHQAVERLERKKADVVFGPSERGRFYLLGLGGPGGSLFREIDWDDPGLEEKIVQWARRNRSRLHLLPPWYGLDTMDDLRRHLSYHALRKGSPSALPCRTGAYLLRIRSRLEEARC